jgi:PAS domain S-box-containing protein
MKPERFAELLDALPDAYVLVDHLGVVRHANSHACAVFGYAPHELCGCSIHELVDETSRAAHVDHVRAYVVHPSTRSMRSGLVCWGRRADGSRVPLDVRLGPLPLEGETAVLASVRVADSFLRREGDLLEMLSDLGIALVITDREGVVRQANGLAHAWTGASALEGLPLASALQLRGIDGEVVDPLAFDGTATHRANLLNSSGTSRPVLIVVRELGIPARTAVVLQDATAAQAALDAHGSQFENILEAAPDGVVLVGRDGTIAHVNAQTERLFGYLRSELVGRPLDVLLPERFRAAHRAYLRRYFAAPTTREMSARSELWGLRKDGTEFAIAVSLSPVSHGGSLYVYAAVRNVEERRAHAARLATAERLAAVGMLAAGVAHEVNNPLAAVLANLDVLRRTQRDDDGALADAYEAAQRIRMVVRDLMVFARSDEQRVPVDVLRVLETSLRMAANQLRHAARVEKHLDAVPPVLGSESRLGQVFLNLLINAAQAIGDGDAEANVIRVTCGTRGRYVVVEVSDTGPGIPPHVLPSLFTPFFTTKPPGVGTGLGLAISHRIVTDHGGAITVDAGSGRGATFRVTLPIMAAQVPSLRPRQPPAGAAPRRGRILVVDDDTLAATAVMRLLSDEHDVETCLGGKEAVQRLASGERFDAILLDVMMPKQGGVDVYEELERVAPEVLPRLVLMTGGVFTARTAAFLSRVPNPRLAKPFDVDELVRTINALVH